MNLNGEDEYYYIRNAQGDIIGLYDKNGEEVVKYSYDSWGKLISINDTSNKDVGEKNPYRYRGYRYDSETGLYYLQSRYYNPEWGRFINADAIAGSVGELLSHNMFVYCSNNPIMYSDPSGFLREFLNDDNGEKQAYYYYEYLSSSVDSSANVIDTVLEKKRNATRTTCYINSKYWYTCRRS
nr:RHS repeat-associated core domain-containing protein [Clostridium ganghwense]